jgi:hypothetical protein
MQFNQTKHLATEFGDQLQEDLGKKGLNLIFLNSPKRRMSSASLPATMHSF